MALIRVAHVFVAHNQMTVSHAARAKKSAIAQWRTRALLDLTTISIADSQPRNR
jgi:hypothetical protein